MSRGASEVCRDRRKDTKVKTVDSLYQGQGESWVSVLAAITGPVTKTVKSGEGTGLMKKGVLALWTS